MLIVLWKVSKSDFQLKKLFHSRIFDMGLSFIFEIFVTSIFEAFYFQFFRNLTNFDPPKKKIHNRDDNSVCLCRDFLRNLWPMLWHNLERVTTQSEPSNVVELKFSEKATKIWQTLLIELPFTEEMANQLGDFVSNFCGLLRKPELYFRILFFQYLHRHNELLKSSRDLTRYLFREIPNNNIISTALLFPT